LGCVELVEEVLREAEDGVDEVTDSIGEMLGVVILMVGSLVTGSRE
jgi:hypothetical protein